MLRLRCVCVCVCVCVYYCIQLFMSLKDQIRAALWCCNARLCEVARFDFFIEDVRVGIVWAGPETRRQSKF